MIKIKLQRKGKKGEAHYRVVIAQSTKARNSNFIDDLGYYNHTEKPYKFEVDMDRLKDWLKKGAKPTETVAQILVKEGVLKNWRETKQSKKSPGRKPKKSAEEAK